ncbi:response regulator transcription factor [Roseovarius sp. 2305UL8-3]|uniref:response regulator transcription factor n=1 Tax=Roseovarius conchicola TaxID=3121636 RepID=UPI0035285A6B
MLIEDVMQIAELIHRGLDAEGWHVVHAGSRKIAFETLDTQNFDVIILDLTLPGCHEQEACSQVQQIYREMRQQADFTPILVLSAFGDVEELKEGLRPSTDDFLVKPFDFDEFVSRLRKLHRGTAVERPMSSLNHPET